MSLFSFAKKGTQPAKKSAKTKAKPAEQKNTSETTDAANSPALARVVRLGLIPLVTEKSVGLQADHNVVTFRVSPNVSKGMIKRAFVDRYQVKPVNIRIISMKGKERRRGQTVGRTSAWKKAYIQLPAGKTIDITA